MINKYIQTLDKIRKNESSISGYLYEEGKDQKGYSCDLNSGKRFCILIALQYNRRESDEQILEQFMATEIEMHKNAPFQGLHKSLRLNAFLLSEFNKPEYSILFARAKNSNFDTHCGFDSEYIVSAGVTETYEYLKGIENEETEAIYEILGKTPKDCYHSEADIRKWKSRMKEWFPSEYNPNLDEELQLAIDLGEDDILINKIEEWKKTISDWNTSTLNQLAYFSSLIEDNKGKLWANEELLKLKKTDWDRASQLQTNSKIYLELSDINGAWKSITKAHEYLQKNLDWKQYGLGRFIIESTLDIMLVIKDPMSDIPQTAFRFFKEEIKGMENLHHNLLRKIIQAAEQMKDNELEVVFKQKLKIAEDELNRILKK